jgi:hypothetical protein
MPGIQEGRDVRWAKSEKSVKRRRSEKPEEAPDSFIINVKVRSEGSLLKNPSLLNQAN